MRASFKKSVFLACLVILLFVFLMYLNFAYDVGIYKEDARTADAIVVLAGGFGRVDKGVELLANGRAGYLIIAGTDKDATLKSIFFKNDVSISTKKIILEKASRSTYENAAEAKKIIEKMGLKSIILITSYYHMKRASYVFSRMLPSHVAIRLYPVTTPNFDETAWWKGRGPILLSLEFFKFYWYRIWI